MHRYNNNAWYYWDAAKGEYAACEAVVEQAPEEPVRVSAMSDIAAEIAAAAGPGSMPLEKAREMVSSFRNPCQCDFVTDAGQASNVGATYWWGLLRWLLICNLHIILP